MNTKDIVQTLQAYSNVFNLDTITGRAIREICWSLIKLLAYIVDAISGVTDKLFNLDCFYNNSSVLAFINSFKPLIVVLFGFSLCVVGYQTMFAKDKEFKKIAINIFIAITVILILPSAMDRMNAITNAGVKAVKGKPTNLANQIIKSNITDLLVYDKLDFDKALQTSCLVEIT